MVYGGISVCEWWCEDRCGEDGEGRGRKKVHEVEEATGDDNSMHIGEILWVLHLLLGWFVGNLDVMGFL